MNDYTTIIVLASTATFATGGLVAWFAYRACRRTGSHALRALAIGFTLVVVGSAIGGLAHLGGDIALGVALQSGVTAIGFATVLYSLFVGPPPTTTTVARWAE
ncbi:DUF7521 family protein [Natronobiforma cellulositropha]|uniref:DUF7521 family protein n=1 Tax=Natronobiforma cellulositropha TaxID=1679076 RepID=UPI0021D59DD9|nr:hypothetical protein [Natronobiforma cellulositropha]